MSNVRHPVIVSAARTPIGRFLGSLSSLSATQLGAIAIREAINRAGIDARSVDEVIVGNVVSAGLGQAPARQAALGGGVPESTSAVAINKLCGSGLMAVMLAAQAIRAGDGNTFVACGMESMSNAPYLLPRARTGYRMGHGALLDALIHDGLWCAFENQHMGMSAEWIADKFKLERCELDEYSANSHRKAVLAKRDGRFRAEIVPVPVPQKKGSLLVQEDELPREDASVDSLAKLPPAFTEGGKITAGNASALSDGGSALVVMEEQMAKKLQTPMLARITGYASAAITPLQVFACPPLAIRKLLSQTDQTLADFDLIEINEAFSSQTLANGKELGWDWERVNVNGGAIALGHPIGASGARVLTTLIYSLRELGLKNGLATLCLAGGGAVAMSIEAI